jgi:hypothetical protein
MGQVVMPGVLVAAAVGLAMAAAGCGVKDDGKGGDQATDDSVPEMTAPEFYKEYSSLKGADRLNKYGDGVLITGKVTKSVYLGQDEGIQLWLGVDGPGQIAARFHDGGAAVKQKKVAVGDQVAMRCQFSGKPDAVLFLVDCVLR